MPSHPPPFTWPLHSWPTSEVGSRRCQWMWPSAYSENMHKLQQTDLYGKHLNCKSTYLACLEETVRCLIAVISGAFMSSSSEISDFHRSIQCWKRMQHTSSVCFPCASCLLLSRLCTLLCLPENLHPVTCSPAPESVSACLTCLLNLFVWLLDFGFLPAPAGFVCLCWYCSLLTEVNRHVISNTTMGHEPRHTGRVYNVILTIIC